MKKKSISLLPLLAVALTTPDALAATTTATTASSSVYVYSRANHTKQLDIIYPQIGGITNGAVQNKLNSLLKNQTTVKPQHGETFTMRYNVNVIQADILNLTISTYDYTGGAHGMPGETSLILDLNKGKEYNMRDMFRTNTQYLKPISNIIRSQDTQKILDSFQKFSGVSANDGFRLRNDGFTIYFSPYQWTPYAVGFPSYNIKYEQVSNFINHKGGLWSALHTSAGKVEQSIVSDDLQKIRSLGYIPDETQMAFLPSGNQRVYAWVGTKGVGNDGESHQRVFFFLNNRYLGTDTKYSHDMVTIYPSGKNTITADYEGTTDLVVHFSWGGGHITSDNRFKTYHSWYKD